MIKLLIPLLLIAFVYSEDTLVNLFTGNQAKPHVKVDAFTFGDGAYTIQFQVSFKSHTRKTILWAQDENVNPEQDPMLVAIQVSAHTMLVAFGSNVYTGIDICCVALNTMYAYTISVEPFDAGNVAVKVFRNDEVDPRFEGTVPGQIANGRRTAYLGAERVWGGGTRNYLNGLLDNFMIVDGILSPEVRVSLYAPDVDYAPPDSILQDVYIFISFDDAIDQLAESKVVAVTNVVNGQSLWVWATAVDGASYQTHSTFSANAIWRGCGGWGDPHMWKWGGAALAGGEQWLGQFTFEACLTEDFEVRSHTRMCVWWGNTIFRMVTIRYKDYLWRKNLDETGNGATRPGWPNVATGMPAGLFTKQITEAGWSVLDGKAQISKTGARISGANGNLLVVVPNIATVSVSRSSMYMDLSLSMNLGVCVRTTPVTDGRFGTCDGEMGYAANIFFEELQAPPPLPDEPFVQYTPCDNILDDSILNKMEQSCRRYYPSNNELYELCLFDACASGDPNIIPTVDHTSECVMQRLLGNTSACNPQGCRGDCFGRGDCNEVDGQDQCVCDTGYGGDDCFQEDTITCSTVSYNGGAVKMNVEPLYIETDPSDANKLNREFTQYRVMQSVLMYPVEYGDDKYIFVVANSDDSRLEGSFRICMLLPLASNPTPTILLEPVANAGFSTGAPLEITEDDSTDWDSNAGKCYDVNFPALSTGGFYFVQPVAGDIVVTFPEQNGLDQVLIGSNNGRGGIDVSKIPKERWQDSGFTWNLEECDNSVCSGNDGACTACYREPGCGYCLETSRCMIGIPSGPRRGVCRNWRFDLDNKISRVVTTKYNGDDLVDPDYKVELHDASDDLPVSLYVPTGKTNPQIDVQFMFGVQGTYALNAEALKNNLLDALYVYESDDAVNLGLGMYSSTERKLTLGLTRVHSKNHPLFARGMEVDIPGTDTTGIGKAGVFEALKKIMQNGGTNYRQFSRRLAVFTVYEIGDTDQRVATRDLILQTNVFPVILIPRDVPTFDAVVKYWKDLGDLLDGIPSLVIPIDPTGSDFDDAFRTMFLLTRSFPHVIIDDITDNQYNHVNQQLLQDEADSLNIFGLTDNRFRARFLIPMKKKSTDTNNYKAQITVPGFGSSIIEDVVDTKPVISEDRSFDGPENSQCIKIVLSATTFNNVQPPVYIINSFPHLGKLHQVDSTADNEVGALIEGTLPIFIPGPTKSLCFVPPAYDHSTPASDVYTSFIYAATDECSMSNNATIDIFVTPIYEPPTSDDVEIQLNETDQETGQNFERTITAFEADKIDETTLETVTFTWSSFSADYKQQFHGDIGLEFYYSVNDSATLTAGEYGPYSTTDFKVERTFQYIPPSPHFFGTLYAYFELKDDNPEIDAGTSEYVFKTVVNPVNDQPIAWSQNDTHFDPTGTAHWIKEDGNATLSIYGQDIDNFGITVDLKLTRVHDSSPSSTISVNGLDLIDGQWMSEICSSDGSSGFVDCQVYYQPAPNYFSCDPLDNQGAIEKPTLTLLETNDCYFSAVKQALEPAITIEYRVNDHNSENGQWPDENGVKGLDSWSENGTVDFHVISVNDPPNPPPNVEVDFLEDAADFSDGSTTNPNVTITITDIDTQKSWIDLFLSSLCPDFVTLLQQDGTPINENDEIYDTRKRLNSQDHTFKIETIPHLHGPSASNNWEICRVTSTAWDGNLTSTSNGYVSIRIKPINDAPYDLLEYFSKAEDYEGEYNIMDLTATDRDNSLSDLTYNITQLPYYNISKSEGVLLYPVDPITKLPKQDSPITVDMLPYTIELTPEDDAILYVKNLANWYGTLKEGQTLIYEVTDIDQFLPEGDEDYIVNTVASTVEIYIGPVNDRPINTIQPSAGDEDTAFVVYLLGENDKFGEQDDNLTVTLEQYEITYSSSYRPATWPETLFQFNQGWWSAYIADPSTIDTSGLTPFKVNENLTDTELYRAIFVPPLHMNRKESPAETPLHISPRLKYRMIEEDSHATPKGLQSTISDWLRISVDAVNDQPVAWGGNWNSADAYATFYGGNDWPYPQDYETERDDYKNSVCIDDCHYTEDFGLEGFYITLAPSELLFGGKDVEGDELTVTIQTADCQAPGVSSPRQATWELINSTGRFSIATADLAGLTMDETVKRYINGEGYKLVTMLSFTPARDDWNVENTDTHENDATGQVSDYYCQLSYVVEDSEGLTSDPKTMTIQVRQSNDQPSDSVLKDPTKTATVIGFEDNNLYIKFDADDVEGDDFSFGVESCDDKRGTFYPPSPAQKNFIQENGELDTGAELNNLFQMQAPIPCNASTITVDIVKYFATDKKGWFLLFVPDKNDFGQGFSSLTVSYDDGTVTSQAPQLSERFIDIRAVNDAPEILSANSLITKSQRATESGQPLSLALSFDDVDARTSDGSEFNTLGFQLRVSSAKLDNSDEFAEAFEYVSGGTLAGTVVKQPTSESDLGMVRWTGSISQSNTFVALLSIEFTSLGEYVVEIVAVDAGRSGFCTPDVELDTNTYPDDDVRTLVGVNGAPLGPKGYEDSQCNRVTVVEIPVRVTVATLVIGGIAAAAGAGFLLLLALGAVLFAKLNKPEDDAAWEALDNAQFANAQQSGIHKEAKVGGKSALYTGKD